MLCTLLIQVLIDLNKRCSWFNQEVTLFTQKQYRSNANPCFLKSWQGSVKNLGLVTPWEKGG